MVVGAPVTSNTSTITITVVATTSDASDVPTIGSDITYTTLPGNALTLNDLANNATDPAGAALTAQIVSGPSNGISRCPSGSGFNLCRPDTGFTGTDTFTYDVSNGTNTSDTATVTIDVSGSNPLIGNSVFEQTPMSQPLTISPSSLLTNAQSASGATITLCSYTEPSNGTLQYLGGNLVLHASNAAKRSVYVLRVTDGTHFYDGRPLLAAKPATRDFPARHSIRE